MKQLMFYKSETMEDVTIVIVPEGSQPFPSVTKPTHRIGTCIGWSLTPGGSPIDEGNLINVVSNMNFFPVWTGLPDPGKWEITFKPNGADGVPYNDYCDDGNTYTLPLTTTFIHPLGYVFMGWATSGNSTSKVSSTYMDRDKVFYAIWKSPTEVGLGHPTGNYVPITGADNMTKMPVTSNGFLPLASWLAPHMNNKGVPSSIRVIYGASTEATIYPDSLFNYKPQHLDNLVNYRIDASGSAVYGNNYAIKDVQSIRMVAATSLIQNLSGGGVPGKEFCGWATQPNIKENLVGKTGAISQFAQLWPVYRKNTDGGKFTVTLDANDGTGRTTEFADIDNEALFVDEGLFAALGVNPPEGKIFAGFAETAFGTPIYHNYYVVARDCKLYAIWVDA